MKETKNITAGIGVKLNKTVSLYQVVLGFINMRQDKIYPKNTFTLHFDKIYETTELAGGDNIFRSKQLTKNGSQASKRINNLKLTR